jgi:cell division protein ZapA
MTSQQPAATVSLGIRLLDRDYQVNCPQDRQEALLAAAGYLDQQLRELRHGGKVMGMEKLAITAALNLAHEVLALRQDVSQAESLPIARVLGLIAAVEGVLREDIY